MTWGGFDRLLSGPTNEIWLTRGWQREVDFQSGTTIKGFKASASGISSVTVEANGQTREVTAD